MTKNSDMNRIEKLFSNKKKNILSIYFTAGYPGIDDTLPIIKALEKTGADMIEIGMPFSDPVADGPVIQRSSETALRNGMSLKLLFRQLEKIRSLTDIPLIIMGYINPFYRFGMENFIRKCRETGIDGTIIPDLPVEEYLESYSSLYEENSIFNIFLISPQTPPDRIIYLDTVSKGFLYMVSTSSTTGMKNGFDESQTEYFRNVAALNLKTPCLTGFGISDRSSFEQASAYSAGAIIGSAFIRALDESGDLTGNIRKFISSVK
jgi:tryptophan synthase alpha chain